MSTAQATIAKIEDHEGFGRCSECEREGLRWIVVLSDGTSVGTECAKRVLGHSVTPKSYSWMTGFSAVAEHVTKFETAVLYRNDKGRTALAINGVLQSMGGGAREFERLFGEAV